MKSFYKNTIKEKHVIIPFIGIDHIRIEESMMSDVTEHLGQPDDDKVDDRENIEISYKALGLTFKSLKALNANMSDPYISYIKINRLFKSFDDKTIYPGLNKLKVNIRMKDLNASQIEKEAEVWECSRGKKMKFFFNDHDILETIIIF